MFMKQKLANRISAIIKPWNVQQNLIPSAKPLFLPAFRKFGKQTLKFQRERGYDKNMRKEEILKFQSNHRQSQNIFQTSQPMILCMAFCIQMAIIQLIMIKDQNREAITQKDELVEQMVAKTYKEMRELGQFETVYEIFSKLPISRIQKEEYQFLFDSVRQNIVEMVNRQDQIVKILEKQQQLVKKIEVKVYRDKQHVVQKGKNVENKANTVTLSNYDFGYLVQNCFSEKLPSNKPIHNSVIYIRNQLYKGNQKLGEPIPFQPDQQYLNLKQIKEQVGDIRMFYNGEEQLKRFEFEFVDENRVQFRSRNFPTSHELEQRADILAKLYLLHLYREEGRKAKQIYKANENQLNKQREIRKIKQSLDVQKIKEGEMIEEMDLVKQVYKILMLIEKKMNELAFSQFQLKNGDKATQIKRSLQKLKSQVHEQPSARNKLKLLITYKHKKGW